MKIFLILIFCMPLVVIIGSGISVVQLFRATQYSKSDFIFGFIVSFLYYSLIYFSLATVNHTSEYSLSGYAFAKFYFAIAMGVTLILYPLIFTLLTTKKLSKHPIHNSLESSIYGFQAGFALFSLLPLSVTTILMQVGIMQIALVFFALAKDTASAFNIYYNLANPNLGLVSYGYLIMFTSFNIPLALTLLNKQKNLNKDQ